MPNNEFFSESDHPFEPLSLLFRQHPCAYARSRLEKTLLNKMTALS